MPVSRSSPAKRRHRVVVVGGGFGGLLARSPSEGRRRRHARRPHEPPPLPAAALPGRDRNPLGGPDRTAAPGSPAQAPERSGSSWPRSPASISRTGRSSPSGRWERALTLPYDSLIVASGSTTSYFGHDELAAALPPDEDDRRRPQPAAADLRGVRAGRDGALGSRAPEVAHLRRRRWRADRLRGRGTDRRARAPDAQDRTFARSTPRAPRCSSSKPTSRSSARSAIGLSRKATRALERIGVEIRTETRVTSIDGDGMDVESQSGQERIATHTVVWAAGVQASPLARILAEASGAECDRAGRVAVRARLHVAGPPRGLRHRRRDDARRAPRRRRRSRSSRATTSRGRSGGASKASRGRSRSATATSAAWPPSAVGTRSSSFHGLRYGGFLGFLSWLLVHLAFLTGFRNRFGALISWSWAFIGRSRDQRAFTVEEIGGSDIYAPTARGESA